MTTDKPADVATTDLTAVTEALFRALHNEGDGGIWESFDAKNALAVAQALTPSVEALIRAERAAAVQAAADEADLWADDDDARNAIADWPTARAEGGAV